MKTFLSAPRAYPWYVEETISFRGYVITEARCLRQKAAADYIKATMCEHGMQKGLRTLNGVFSIVLKENGRIMMAVDRLRALPLFYAVQDGELYVGDDAESIVQSLPHVSINQCAVEAYHSTKLYTLGADTMLKELQQVQAGCYCIFEEATAQISETSYFRMVPGVMETDLECLTQHFTDAYRQVGAHLVQALNGRTAVVPLSGGADSRMVLSMLKEQNYEKVLCFTYGRPGNVEAQISKKVAEHFGYPWEFVPYDSVKWRKIAAAKDTEQYCRRACSYVSTPHLQDFLAVKELHEAGKLPSDSVFVPGHSGDMIAGSHISAMYLKHSLSRNEFLDDIIEHFIVEKPTSALMQQLEQRFPAVSPSELEEMAAQSAWFNIQERQAKFIVNSVRVYEFFGYEWLIPLWDNILFAFWSHVPISWRYQRKLYFAAVQNCPISSTADVTAYVRLCNKIRTIPFVRMVARRATRVLRYWRSTLYVEKMFPMREYLLACIRENELFDVNYLLCKRRIAALCYQHGKIENLEKDLIRAYLKTIPQ